MEPGEQAAYRRAMEAAAERGSAWQLAAAGVALVALAARVHNAFAYPPLLDFDGPGHAENVLALHRGELPDALAWAGFHPPLYHALGALLWWLLPASLPVHVTLRLLSAAFGAGVALLTWRGLRRFVAPADAAIAAALALAAPVATIAGSMIGNETACAFFITAALLHLVAIPDDPRALVRHARVTALPLSLAALTKSTALVAIAASGLLYATRVRLDARRALVAAAWVVAIPTAVLAPHALRLLEAGGGSMLAVVSGAAVSRDAREEMAAQPPGLRRLADYGFVPLATWTEPVYSAPGLVRSVPGLLWASAWADGHAQFLPPSVPRVGVGGCAHVGGGRRSDAARGLRARAPGARAAPLRGGGGSLALSRAARRVVAPLHLGHPRVLGREGELSARRELPRVAAAGGWDRRPRTARARARARRGAGDFARDDARVLVRLVDLRMRSRAAWLLAAVAIGCGGAPEAPQDVVALYFRSLGRDPIRSAALVTPEFHARHGLRIQSAWTDTASGERPFRLSSAELAWLGVQRRPEFFAYAPRLRATVTAVQRDDALHAVVTTRVEGPGAPPFTQRFALVRASPRAGWQIDRIEQEDLVAANRIAAFVASPSRAGRRGSCDGWPLSVAARRRRVPRRAWSLSTGCAASRR